MVGDILRTIALIVFVILFVAVGLMQTVIQVEDCGQLRPLLDVLLFGRNECR